MPADRSGQQCHPSYEPFTPDELLLFRSAGRVRAWERGESLMREGGRPDHVVLVLSGLAKVTAESDNGYTSVLALRGPGELVGELSCLDGTVRSATVTAMEHVEGVVVGADAFLRLLGNHASLTLAVLRSVVTRLRQSDTLRADQGARSSRSVLARVLLDTAVRHGIAPVRPPGALEVRMNQQELAGAAGISRESVVRCLRAMHTAGLVSTSRGRILVLDLAGVRRWAEEE
ncbi:Crp/Fnr family transcriptional regulator [Streptomyces sp. NBC_01142]|uniref:Crp/Fnr family transcriptional regulator n=1 Tax=Streptomyces sp. NBC_01142 TaxID=2975865 RepID=UPI00225995B6|nr:Crp/Fnr family transcriptional regulator [Streptomyces sp. NBC_01142]MCX4822179.1 Crp/Fnr family transcriptional regulator [Streptomyces sp. NBC_01142]